MRQPHILLTPCQVFSESLGFLVPADPRSMITLARTNWLHSKYNIVSCDTVGPLLQLISDAIWPVMLICNENYLYTPCLFLLEPAVYPSFLNSSSAAVFFSLPSRYGPISMVGGRFALWRKWYVNPALSEAGP